MSETIAQSQSENYSKSVGTAAVVLVKGGGNGQSGSGIVTVGGTINVPRSVVVHNAHASQVLYVGWGSDVTSSSGFPIAAGGYMEFDLLFTDELWAVGSGADTDARIFVLHGKGNPPFSPLELSPTLWLDASDTSTISETAGAVDTWSDKSGNGNDVTQATGTDQPATGTRTLNGLNVLDFDGTNDRLWRSNVLTSAVDNITMILAYDADGVTGTRVPFTNGNGGNGYGISHTPDGANYGWLQGGVAWKTSSTSATTGAQIVLFEIVSGTVSMRVNGAVVSGVQQATPTTPTAQFTIGSHVNSGGSAWDGGVAEAIFVDGTLTAQQISDTETYLADKWGITI